MKKSGLFYRVFWSIVGMASMLHGMEGLSLGAEGIDKISHASYVSGPYRKVDVVKPWDDTLYRKVAKSTQLPSALVFLIVEYFLYESPQKLRVKLCRAGSLIQKGKKRGFEIEEDWYNVVLHHSNQRYISGHELMDDIEYVMRIPRSLLVINAFDFTVSEGDDSDSGRELTSSAHQMTVDSRYLISALHGGDYSLEVNINKSDIEKARKIIEQQRFQASRKLLSWLFKYKRAT